MHVRPDALIRKIAYNVGYTGRKFKFEVSDEPIRISSTNRSGGTWDSWHFVRLSDCETVEYVLNSPYDHIETSIPLADGMIAVRHTRFCGKDLGLTFVVRPENAAKVMNAPTVELSRDEQIVLCATRSYIASCRRDEAKRVTGITERAYAEAVELLKSKRLLSKSGAITIEGRNAIGRVQLYEI